MDLSDVKVRLRLVIEYINIGNLEQAEKHLYEIKKNRFAKISYVANMAQVALKSGDPNKMKEVAAEGLKQMSKQAWILCDGAEMFIQSDELGEQRNASRSSNRRKFRRLL